MTKTKIAVTQNEVAILPKSSQLTLITDGLLCCVAIVLRGPLGFALMHFTQNSDLNSIVREMRKLGPGTTVRLFKWAHGEGDLEEQIEDYLIRSNLSRGLELTVIKFDTNKSLPCGFLEVNADKEWIPDNKTINMFYAKDNRTENSIDFGLQDYGIRTYKTILSRYLDPLKDIPVHVIYENNEWKEEFQLGDFNLRVISDLLDVANDGEQLNQKIFEMLDSTEEVYKARYSHLSRINFTYFLCCMDRNAERKKFTEDFSRSLTGLYDYTIETQQSFSQPVSRSRQAPCINY